MNESEAKDPTTEPEPEIQKDTEKMMCNSGHADTGSYILNWCCSLFLIHLFILV